MKNADKKDRLAPNVERGIRPDVLSIQRSEKGPYSQEVEDYDKYVHENQDNPGSKNSSSRVRKGR